MNKYTFFIDRKVTMWVREEHIIESETKEKANEKMIENFNNNNTDETFLQQHWIDETIADMSKEENNGNSVTEVYDNDMEFLIKD